MPEQSTNEPALHVGDRVTYTNVNLYQVGTVTRVSLPWVFVRWDGYLAASKEWATNLRYEPAPEWNVARDIEVNAVFRDPNPLNGADWGYTCLVGTTGHGTQWLPARYREPARAALASLRQQLGKLTKAKLAAYIADRGGFVDGRERKSDLVTAAVNKQMERLFPYRDPQPGDRDG